MGVSQPKVRKLFSELLLAQNKKFTSDCFATLNADFENNDSGNLKITNLDHLFSPKMMNLRFELSYLFIFGYTSFETICVRSDIVL